MRVDDFIGVIFIGVIIGVLLSMGVLISPIRSQGFNGGLKAAVACSPGVFLQKLDSGKFLCIGGNEETWMVSGR